MKRALTLFILLFSLKLFPDANYIIYNSKGEAGYLTISVFKDSVYERVLMTDGFSREYTAASYSLRDGYSYKSVSYFADDQLPVKISCDGKVLSRVSAGIKSSIRIDGSKTIIYNGSAPASSALLINAGRNKWKAINAYSFKYISEPASGFKCFGKGTYPDSIISGNYRICRTERYINIENPYAIDYSAYYIRDDFAKKKIVMELNIGEGARGELIMDAPSDTVAVVFPFTMNYDMYGNMSSQTAPFTSLQIGEGIAKPVYIFEFTINGKKDYASLSETVSEIDRYFSSRYKKVVYIAFNECALLAADVLPYASIIAINPVLEKCRDYSDMIFQRSNKRLKIFAESERFFRSNPVFSKFEYADPVSIYSKQKGRRAYILSWSVLTPKERENSLGLSGKVVKMNNIDRRLNDNILYDLWSFKKKIKIDEKIIKYLNALINKL